MRSRCARIYAFTIAVVMLGLARSAHAAATNFMGNTFSIVKAMTTQDAVTTDLVVTNVVNNLAYSSNVAAANRTLASDGTLISRAACAAAMSLNKGQSGTELDNVLGINKSSSAGVASIPTGCESVFAEDYAFAVLTGATNGEAFNPGRYDATVEALKSIDGPSASLASPEKTKFLQGLMGSTAIGAGEHGNGLVPDAANPTSALAGIGDALLKSGVGGLGAGEAIAHHQDSGSTQKFVDESKLQMQVSGVAGNSSTAALQNELGQNAANNLQQRVASNAGLSPGETFLGGGTPSLPAFKSTTPPSASSAPNVGGSTAPVSPLRHLALDVPSGRTPANTTLPSATHNVSSGLQVNDPMTTMTVPSKSNPSTQQSTSLSEALSAQPKKEATLEELEQRLQRSAASRGIGPLADALSQQTVQRDLAKQAATDKDFGAVVGQSVKAGNSFSPETKATAATPADVISKVIPPHASQSAPSLSAAVSNVASIGLPSPLARVSSDVGTFAIAGVSASPVNFDFVKYYTDKCPSRVLPASLQKIADFINRSECAEFISQVAQSNPSACSLGGSRFPHAVKDYTTQLKCAAVHLAASEYACDSDSGKTMKTILMSAQARMIAASQHVLPGANQTIAPGNTSGKIENIYAMACSKAWPAQSDSFRCEINNLNPVSWAMVGGLMRSFDAARVEAKDLASAHLDSALNVLAGSGCDRYALGKALYQWNRAYSCVNRRDEASCGVDAGLDEATVSKIRAIIPKNYLLVNYKNKDDVKVFENSLKNATECKSCLVNFVEPSSPHFGDRLNSTNIKRTQSATLPDL